MTALDTDKNGELSAPEIAAAAAMLKTLDKDGDGKLSVAEMRPKPMPVVVPPSEVVARLMEFDRNGDGKLTRSELPARMKRFLDQADANHDGILNESELTAIATKHEAERQETERKTLALAQANPPPAASAPGLAEPNGAVSRPGQERPPEGRGAGGPGGPPPGGGRVPPLMAALDTNKDGELSSEELVAATTSLKTLDKDADGKLSADEMRPPRPSGREPRSERGPDNHGNG
jgi:hypothetical protein